MLPTARVWLIACAVAGSLPASLLAAGTAPPDLNSAVDSGGVAAYLDDLSAWIGNQMPATAEGFSESDLNPLLDDPTFANALGQRRLIAKLGAVHVVNFTKAGPPNKEFLTWLLRNTQAMETYLEAATPSGLRAREADQWTLPIASLERWRNIYFADPDSRTGHYLKLAIATALAPPGSGSPGAGQAPKPVAPLDRYLHFKTAHQQGELFPSFDHLTAWELTKVVQSGASNEDLAWGRKMINTWRPDLRENEMVVNSTSEVWRRNSPISFDNTYKNVLTGGGKCGPRSSWSVFICQAFGVPAIGVGQPRHACVAWKAVNPRVEPQPGSAWKVGYGRGWQFSKLDGMSGPEFLEGVAARAHAARFSQVERLRSLASALPAGERASAVLNLARQISATRPTEKTDLTASLKPEEAEADPGVRPPQAKPTALATPDKPSPAEKPPIQFQSGVATVDAASFTQMGGEVSYQGLQVAGVRVHNSYPGPGQQVYFQSNMKSAWVDYLLDVPAAGEYVVVMKTAAVNLDQKLDVRCGEAVLATIDVPMSTGLWGTTQAARVQLNQGIQTLRVAAPFQRGIALKSIELRPAAN